MYKVISCVLRFGWCLIFLGGCGGSLGPVDPGTTQDPDGLGTAPGRTSPGVSSPVSPSPSDGNESGQGSPSGQTGTPAAVCGNSVREGQEVCDGDSQPCANLGQGFTGGNAPCNKDCKGYDTSACVGASSGAPDLTSAEAKKQISLARYKEFVTKLASSEFAGRKYGTAGGLKTVEYVESKFKEAGLAAGPSNANRLAMSKGYNTIGVIPGTDPTLKNKVIIVSGHHDHLGNSGCLYAGADDDASGTAAVMELAFVMMKLKNTLKRTVVFMTFDAEELGCVGASAYLKSPAYPLADTILMLDFDMIGRNGSYGAAEGWTFTSPKGVTREVMGGGTPEEFVLVGKGEPEGVYCDFNSDVFQDKGVKTKLWFTGCDDTYHECTDTVDRMEWDAAIRIVNEGFDAIWKAAQG